MGVTAQPPHAIKSYYPAPPPPLRMRMWQGEEWAIFAAMPRSTLGAFRQITFELHGVTNDGLACRKLRPGWRSCWRLGGVHNVSETVALLEALDRQFVLVSNHGNNWWGAHSIASRVVPDLTEVTYVNRGALPPDFACEPVTADAINRLHVKNLASAPEIKTLSAWTGARQGLGIIPVSRQRQRASVPTTSGLHGRESSTQGRTHMRAPARNGLPASRPGSVSLRSGRVLPLVGLGTGGLNDTMVEVVAATALGLGYRHFDTAEYYHNEAGLGKALARTPRRDIFVTTKYYGGCVMGSDGDVLRALRASLSRLSLSYVDLYLMHLPGIRSGDRRACPSAPPNGPALRLAVWGQMERAVKLGLAREIGVANFGLAQLEALLDAAPVLKIVPSVLQVEYQPHYHDDELRQFCDSRGIRLIAYGPLRATTEARSSSQDALHRVAVAHNVTLVRVALKWIVMQGVAVIPRSSSAAHLAENLQIGDSGGSGGGREGGPGPATSALRLSADELASIGSVRRRQQYSSLARDMQDGALSAQPGKQVNRRRGVRSKKPPPEQRQWDTESLTTRRTLGSLATPAWTALEGHSAAEVLRQHADPLGALSQGLVPAVVLRGHLDPALSAALVARLPHHPHDPVAQHAKWAGADGVVGGWVSRSTNYSTLGVDLKKEMARGPGMMAQATRKWQPFFDAHGLDAAHESLHAALRDLSVNRTVAVGRDVGGSNRTLSPGIFRAHGHGNAFLPHFDTLHSYRWNRRGCARQMGAPTAPMLHASIDRFPDLARFDEQFSALLVLQRPDDGSLSDVSLYQAPWTTLLGDCALVGQSHGMGVNLGASWTRSTRSKVTQSASLRLGPGDFYVFNSNRVHEVTRVQGAPRITLGTFVGYSPSEMRIWA